MLLIFLLMGLATYFSRSLLLIAIGRVKLSPAAERALRYIPVGIFSALVVPGVFLPEGNLVLASNPFIPAAAITAAVAWQSKNIVVSMLVGMGAVVILRLV